MREEELIVREDIYALPTIRALLDAASEGLLLTSADGKVSSCNARFLALWGLESLETGSSLDALAEKMVSSSDDEDFAQDFFKEVKNDPASVKAHLFETTAGKVIECLTRPVLVDGVPLARLWNFRDATKDRDLFDAFEKSESRLVSLLLEQELTKAAHTDLTGAM